MGFSSNTNKYYVGKQQDKLKAKKNILPGRGKNIMALLLAGSITFGGVYMGKAIYNKYQNAYKEQVIESVHQTPNILPISVLAHLDKNGININSIRQAVLDYETLHDDNSIRKLAEHAPHLIYSYLAVIKHQVLQKADLSIDLSQLKVYRSDSTSGDMSVYAVDSRFDEIVFRSGDSNIIDSLTNVIELTRKTKKQRRDEAESGNPVDIDKADSLASSVAKTYLDMINFQKEASKKPKEMER